MSCSSRGARSFAGTVERPTWRPYALAPCRSDTCSSVSPVASSTARVRSRNIVRLRSMRSRSRQPAVRSSDSWSAAYTTCVTPAMAAARALARASVEEVERHVQRRRRRRRGAATHRRRRSRGVARSARARRATDHAGRAEHDDPHTPQKGRVTLRPVEAHSTTTTRTRPRFSIRPWALFIWPSRCDVTRRAGK